MQLGVSVPIKNHKYRLGTRWTNALSSTGPQGTPGNYYFVSETDSFTPVWPRQCFENSISRILVGPSTNTANLGAREILTVASVTHPNQIYVVEDPQFQYNIGDPLSGIGERMPGGWQLASDDSNGPSWTEVLPGGIRDKGYGADPLDRGVYDAYRFKLQINDSNNQHVEQSFQDGAFLASTQYLLGFYYKITFPASASGPAFYAQLSVGGTNIINEQVREQADGDVLTWTYWDSRTSADAGSFSVGVNGVTTATPTTPLILRLPKPVGGSANNNTIELDSPFICHAQGTDDYLSGIYTFDELPAYGSMVWTPRTFVQQTTLASGDKVSYDPTGGGGRIRKWTLTCTFENVNASFYDQLMILQEWQDEGNDLVLITNEEQHGSSLPVVLVGRMSHAPVGRKHWDMSQRSFQFDFVES